MIIRHSDGMIQLMELTGNLMERRHLWKFTITCWAARLKIPASDSAHSDREQS